MGSRLFFFFSSVLSTLNRRAPLHTCLVDDSFPALRMLCGGRGLPVAYLPPFRRGLLMRCEKMIWIYSLLRIYRHHCFPGLTIEFGWHKIYYTKSLLLRPSHTNKLNLLSTQIIWLSLLSSVLTIEFSRHNLYCTSLSFLSENLIGAHMPIQLDAHLPQAFSVIC